MIVPNDSSHRRICFRIFLQAAWLLVVFLLLAGGVRALAQTPAPDDSAMRTRALQFCNQKNYPEALPLLEKLAAAHPTDSVILQGLGEALVNASAGVTDPAARKQIILRARSVLLRAKDLGNKSDIITTLLEKLPEDGELTPFSVRKEVDDAMREGEVAFSKNDMAGALAAYQRALELDPTTYHAALFTGDVYFRMNQMDKAGEWYAKAVVIDPDEETAYRYWGDALMKGGKMEDARAKFIEAVVCEPYQRTTWSFLRQWAEANHATISHPQIELPKVEGSEHINITMGADTLGKKDGSEAWLIYTFARASWHGERFNQEFPKEKTYRHSLREEVDALDTACAGLEKNYPDADRRQTLQPQLVTLMELHEKGMIEPFILLSKADAGIAQDYAVYRAEYRDKLRQYISEWLIKPAAAR